MSASSASFEKNTIDTLARIETKMDIIVGQDGNGGRLNDLENRMRSVERRKWRISGVAGVAGAGISSILAWAFRHFLR